MSADEPSDAALVAAALGGGQAAFTALMRRHKDRLYRIIRRNLGDADEAHDVLQQSFAAAWGALARYDPARPFEHWLTRIALNKCRDWARRRAVRRWIGALPADGAAERIVDPAPLADTLLADRGELAALDRAIAALPVKLKEPLILTALEGLSQADAGARLGISAKAVETRTYRARRLLAAAVGRR